MKTLLSLLLLPAVAALLVATPVRAESRVCHDRTNLVKALVDDYGEQLAEVHDIKDRGLLEFHVSPTEGTWTALLTNEAGVSCVLATGEGVDPVKSLHIEPGLPI